MNISGDNLPFVGDIPVAYLSAVFNNVTNAYKFYWFLSNLPHNPIAQTNKERPSSLLGLSLSLPNFYPFNRS